MDWENERLRYPTAEHRRQVARIWDCNKERVPFIVYADLEYVLWKTESEKMRHRTHIKSMKYLI